jgi:hypothetical protein
VGSESNLEKKRKKEVKQGGGLYLKQNGHPGVPDRLVLMPVEDEEHRKIVERYVWFEELKSATGVLSALQIRIIGWLERRGYKVEVKRVPKRSD